MGFEERIQVLCESAAQCCCEDEEIKLSREWKEVLQQMVEERRRLGGAVGPSKKKATAS
jgi:hypothetical protein